MCIDIDDVTSVLFNVGIDMGHGVSGHMETQAV